MPSPPQRRADAQGAREVTVEIGAVLFREGDAGETVFFIEDGAVKLSKRAGSAEVIVAEFGPGELVGEVGVLCNQPHATTATATCATRCLAVDGGTLEAMLAGDMELTVRLVQTLAVHVARGHERVVARAVREDVTRVALLIAGHAESATQTPEGRLITRRLGELGALAGVEVSALAAVGTELVRARLIRIRNNGLLVPEVARIYEWVKSRSARASGGGDGHDASMESSRHGA
ncbi:MAG: Crp/Fnr family transcriptional regulator [Myxococcales bacterium]|nr:Crp/Fnr family transcriptional regulator [Myxococcales bacterium]